VYYPSKSMNMKEQFLIADTMEDQQDQLIEEIKDIIYNDVRPYIEMDGGRIEFSRLEDDIVYVRLFGACVGCPSSSLTLKGGVEKAIRKKMPHFSVELEDVQPLGMRPF